MKKYLLLASVAALAFTSCSDQSTEFVGDEVAQKAREIAFAPLAKPTTRAAWDGTAFPTSGYGFKLAAYDATNTAAYFINGDYTYSTGSGASIVYHDATTPRYWPIADTWLHFLGVSYMTTAADNVITTDFSSYATNGTASVTLSDNSVKQNDLMYGITNGHIVKSGNSITYPGTPAGTVAMQFKHALASMRFIVQANVASQITLTSIVVNNAYNAGTFDITHTGYGNTSATESVAGVWTEGSVSATTTVPGISNVAVGTSASSQYGLLVVPKTSGASFGSFTINYMMNNIPYSFEYTPADLTLAQGKKYIYNITFTLSEILVNTTVVDWEANDFDGTASGQQDATVNIP